mmetsp:Transcript_3800/g.6588  ORF Transcript_3800/g.6588 Transcript_3800/m.6588 type:complete len:81 (-) Transcript_3800:7-249(-)
MVMLMKWVMTLTSEEKDSAYVYTNRPVAMIRLLVQEVAIITQRIKRASLWPLLRYSQLNKRRQNTCEVSSSLSLVGDIIY